MKLFAGAAIASLLALVACAQSVDPGGLDPSSAPDTGPEVTVRPETSTPDVYVPPEASTPDAAPETSFDDAGEFPIEETGSCKDPATDCPGGGGFLPPCCTDDGQCGMGLSGLICLPAGGGGFPGGGGDGGFPFPGS
jgi:hypothetical protein